MPLVRLAAWALRQHLWRVLAALTILHAAAVALFSSGFLLTRVELTQRSRCDSAECLGAGCPPQDLHSVPQRPPTAECSVVEADECPRKVPAFSSDSKTSALHKPSTADAVSTGRPHAQQSQDPGDQRAADAATNGLRCGPPHFNKTLWLIVDALRFDFVLHELPAAADRVRDGDAASRSAAAPLSAPPRLAPHVQKMPELLSLGRDWVRTDVAPA